MGHEVNDISWPSCLPDQLASTGRLLTGWQLEAFVHSMSDVITARVTGEKDLPNCSTK